MYTDPIADYLTRVRNVVRANHKVVEIPASNMKKEITKILFDQGYILSYKFDDSTVQGTIKIALKYDKDTKESVIKDIQRISKPGLRKYASSSDLPRILNGLGIAIVSTSKGLMTGKQAKQLNVGGEVICLRILIKDETMSRIGKNPIAIPAGVTVEVKDAVITVKGKLGELTQEFSDVTVKIEDNQVIVERSSDYKTERAKHGLYRALINNMIVGV